MENGANRLANLLVQPKKRERRKTLKELRELSRLLARQAFGQIPGVSAAAALIVGGWVASTFTTSPLRATLASWGLIRGGRHVVSGPMYRFLSIGLPIFAAGITAYLVQKVLKSFRERRMQNDILRISKLGKDIQAPLQEKLVLLEKAREAELLSYAEYLTKKANLYDEYSRILPVQIKDLLISKLIG